MDAFLHTNKTISSTSLIFAGS